ncbi:hypothetical protein HF086_011808 [Spodoptera exigua]|uniref:Uncharacterized protein n=1 Tax=Spodoptera exigua TaxID=7107 RepID=A0A922MXH9_SPOEX|nr:hypothetical protein HF086_011808 [Spodoptera exigua]
MTRLGLQYGYRAVSPGLVLREYRDAGAVSPHRITTYSYLTSEPSYLRRPLQPYDRAPASPHFHRPPSGGSRASSRAGAASKASSRPAMRALVDSIRGDTPRPKSPHMNNEEPIELSHYPAAYKPPPGTKPKIERDDFPAPPYPYTDPERRRRWSDTYKGVADSDDEGDGKANGKVNGNGDIDPKLRREEHELSKIESGIAQVFLKEVKEREKLQQWKKQNLDPRNASRTPSASREPLPRLRYSSPVGASPSRSLEARPHEPDALDAPVPCYNVRPGSGLRSATLPAALGRPRHVSTPPQPSPLECAGGGYRCSVAVVSSLRAAPRPGYGLAPRSHTFSSSTATTDGGVATRGVARAAGSVAGSVAGRYASVAGATVATGAGGGAGVRRSLPNMATSHLLHEPAKLYPYHLLLITNYRLPPDVDRLNLEVSPVPAGLGVRPDLPD